MKCSDIAPRKWVQNCFGASFLSGFWILFGFAVLPVDLAMCHILELEVAVAMGLQHFVQVTQLCFVFLVC